MPATTATVALMFIVVLATGCGRLHFEFLQGSQGDADIDGSDPVSGADGGASVTDGSLPPRVDGSTSPSGDAALPDGWSADVAASSRDAAASSRDAAASSGDAAVAIDGGGAAAGEDCSHPIEVMPGSSAMFDSCAAADDLDTGCGDDGPDLVFVVRATVPSEPITILTSGHRMFWVATCGDPRSCTPTSIVTALTDMDVVIIVEPSGSCGMSAFQVVRGWP